MRIQETQNIKSETNVKQQNTKSITNTNIKERIRNGAEENGSQAHENKKKKNNTQYTYDNILELNTKNKKQKTNSMHTTT